MPVYKGTVNCSANPNYPAADSGWEYLVSVGGKIGGASGKTVVTGDLVICKVNGSATGNEATVGANWDVVALGGVLTSDDLGITVQDHSNDLDAISALTSAADKFPYATGAGAWALGNVSSFGRSLIDDSSASTARTTLGLGTIATATAPSGAVVGTTDTQTLSNKTLTNPIATGNVSITSTGNASIEIGRTDGTASTPFIDFHSGSTAVDRDARIIVSGGTGSNDGADLDLRAATLTHKTVPIVTTTGTQTLTNKTLQTPAFTSITDGDVEHVIGLNSSAATKKMGTAAVLTDWEPDYSFRRYVTAAQWQDILSGVSTAPLSIELQEAEVDVNSKGGGFIRYPAGVIPVDGYKGANTTYNHGLKGGLDIKGKVHHRGVPFKTIWRNVVPNWRNLVMVRGGSDWSIKGIMLDGNRDNYPSVVHYPAISPIDCSTNPNYPAATLGQTYSISNAGRIGGASGKTVFQYNVIRCIASTSPTGNEAAVGANWEVKESDVVRGEGIIFTGEANAVDNVVLSCGVMRTGHYGIGVQNANVSNLAIHDCYGFDIGGDFIDTKPTATSSKTILSMTNNVVRGGIGRNWQQHTVQAAYDIRGAWLVANNWAFDIDTYDPTQLGNDAFRVNSDVISAGERKGGARSILMNNWAHSCKAADEGSSTTKRVRGLVIGDTNVSVGGFYAENFLVGCIVDNAADSEPHNTHVTGLHVKNCKGSSNNGIGMVIGIGSSGHHIEATIEDCDLGFQTNGTDGSGTIHVVNCTKGNNLSTGNMTSNSYMFVNSSNSTNGDIDNNGANVASLQTIWGTANPKLILHSTKDGSFGAGEALAEILMKSGDVSGYGQGARAAIRALMSSPTGGTTSLALYATGNGLDTKFFEGNDRYLWALLAAIPTFANDTDAGTGGVTQGCFYKTSTGQLMIKL